MEKMIIGIAGENASGKDTVTKCLVEKYGASHHKFSGVLRDVLDRLGLEQSRKNIDTASTVLRQAFGDDLLSRAICAEVERDESPLVVIDGVRRESDLSCVRNVPGFRLVYVDAAMEKRYQRITRRNENVDDSTKTWEDFLEESQAEPQLRIRDLKGIADCVVDNNGTLEELCRQVDELMAKCRG
jgi:dephospho-CoA kinase